MKEHVDRLIARHFQSRDGELNIGGVPVGEIAGRYGTPTFIHDRHVLDRKWDLLRQALPSDFDICYSVKANPNPAIVGHFLSKGSGLEIASAGEFHIALRAGCPPDRIMFAGPGKTENELEEVLAGGIGEIHAESGREVERIGAISRRLGVKARVAVRINPGEEAQGGAMRMGGKPSPFGVDEGELDPVLDLVSTTDSIEFNGIHLFTGTQILDHATLLRQYRQGLDIARKVWKNVKRSLPVVDFGGGLGIPYYVNEKELDLDGFREGLLSMMAEIQGEEPFRGTRFVVEPGRFLVGESGVYLTRINDIKVSRGKKYVVVDGGMNHHLAASGNLGQVIRKNFPLAIANKLGEEPREVVDVAGPLCTPLDVLARDVPLPRPEIGDLVAIFQSGAYARTASPLGFLSHPTPAEVLAFDGNVRLIRRPGNYDDLFRDFPLDSESIAE